MGVLCLKIRTERQSYLLENGKQATHSTAAEIKGGESEPILQNEHQMVVSKLWRLFSDCF